MCLFLTMFHKIDAGQKYFLLIFSFWPKYDNQNIPVIDEHIASCIFNMQYVLGGSP